MSGNVYRHVPTNKLQRLYMKHMRHAEKTRYVYPSLSDLLLKTVEVIGQELDRRKSVEHCCVGRG